MIKFSNRNLKTITFDFTFIITGFICLYLKNKYNTNPYFNNGFMYPLLNSFAIAVGILIIKLFPLRLKEDKSIYVNKNGIYLSFILVSILQGSIYITNYLFKLNEATLGNFYIIYALLMAIGLTITIFISYFFKFRLRDFNWNISLKALGMIVVTFLAYIFILNLSPITKGKFAISSVFNSNFLISLSINTIINSAFPGFYEEVLYRGFLISGLKGLDLNEDISNIIQAIIFGITHFMSFGEISWISLLSTAAQAMFGYLLGKVYFKTKSLTPCILLHGLIDAVG